MVIEIGVKVEVKVEQGVLWFVLEFVSSAYSIPRLVYLILRLVNSERLRCLLMMV
jgi:hypothetical protein